MEKIFTTIFLTLINLLHELKNFVAIVINKITTIICFVTMLRDKDYRLKTSSLSDHPPAS